MNPSRNEPDVVSVPTVLVVGSAALAVFSLGILWAALIQRDNVGSLHNRQENVTEAGKLEVGLDYQRPFGHPDIAAGNAARQRQKLLRFGWADPAHKTVFLPIDQAKQLFIERGRP